MHIYVFVTDIFCAQSYEKSTPHVPDVTFVTVTGVEIKVLGLGPLNWVWKLFVIGSVKKSLKLLLTLKIRDQLELCLKRESIIEKLYIPILERKFSRRWIIATFSTLWYFVILSYLPTLNAIKKWKIFSPYCAVLLLTSYHVLGIIIIFGAHKDTSHSYSHLSLGESPQTF